MQVQVPITITGWSADEPQPGLVRCTLVDAHDVAHAFVDKVAVVTDAPLDARAAYPQPGVIAATVVGTDGALRVDPTIPWGLELPIVEVDRVALGAVTVYLPDASEPACWCSTDLAALFGVATSADAVTRLREAWRQRGRGRLDLDAEADAVLVRAGKDAIIAAVVLIQELAGRALDAGVVDDTRRALRAYRRPAARPWRVGDVFTIPLPDGSSGFGQVLWEDTFAAGSGVRAPTCALLDHRATGGVPELLELVTAPTVAILHVASRHLDRGTWRVVGNHPPVDDPFAGPHGRPGTPGAVSWDGLEVLAAAWFGLTPWNAWAVPYERSLLPGRRPASPWLLSEADVARWRAGERLTRR